MTMERSNFCSQSNQNPSNYSWCHLNRFSINGLRVQQRQQRTNVLMVLLLFAIHLKRRRWWDRKSPTNLHLISGEVPASSSKSVRVSLIIRTYTTLCLVKHTTDDRVCGHYKGDYRRALAFSVCALTFLTLAKDGQVLDDDDNWAQN